MTLSSPEFARRLVELMRDYLKQQADLRMLAAMLTLSEETQQPVVGWLEALKLGRQIPEYQRIAGEHDELFLRFEQAVDAKEIEQLFAAMPPTLYPN
jgi:hypothetical protein